MRRKDKQITDESLIAEILAKNTVCRLALADGDNPYVVPMNYGYKEKTFYFHSAQEGKKLDFIKKNNKVCLEIADSIELVSSDRACGHGTKYRSLICFGTIHFVSDPHSKVEAMKVIMQQQTGRLDWEIPEVAMSKVAILRVDVDFISGKISGF